MLVILFSFLFAVILGGLISNSNNQKSLFFIIFVYIFIIHALVMATWLTIKDLDLKINEIHQALVSEKVEE